ncbi:MAG: lmo0937 family membrane protein [Balneolaceae bacterium]
MEKLVYVIAAFLILFWGVGFFVYSLGAIVHLLLVVAVITIVMRLMRRDRNIPTDNRTRPS